MILFLIIHSSKIITTSIFLLRKNLQAIKK